MLYLIGLGIHDVKNMSLEAIEALKKCHSVYFEKYTSNVRVSENEFKRLGIKAKELSRKDVEETDIILESAKKGDTAFIVPGDPLVATTHTNLVSSAIQRKIKYRIVHASSIVSSVAETGLHIYKFGKTASIPKTTEEFFPKSPYEMLEGNLMIKAHTLFLLDIGMSANQAIEYLFAVEKQEKKGVISKQTKAVVCTELGGKSGIIYSTLGSLLGRDYGSEPQVLIIPSELHFTEQEFLGNFES